MKGDNINRKDELVSGTTAVVSLILVVVFLLACGLKTQVPPPPSKKVFLVELDADVGGGGGGGMDVPTPSRTARTSAPNYATQNAQDAPSIAHSDKTTTKQDVSATATPKINQSAIFKGGRGGTGSGGGSGSGIGTGTGSGLGPGTGSGSGGGIGYGTGTRGMVKSIKTTVNEEGQVCVEVHVMEDGTVKDARVISTGKFKTTITNRMIQQQCKEEALRAKYRPGKEELRVIIFK